LPTNLLINDKYNTDTRTAVRDLSFEFPLVLGNRKATNTVTGF